MATPAAVKAPAASETAPEGRRAQKLREAQIKKLPISRLKPVGHYADPQQVLLPADWDFEDVLKPEAWTSIAPLMQANPSASVMADRLGTVVHVMTEDHAFYALLYVHGLRRNALGQADALYVACIGPCYDPATDTCGAVDVRTGKRWKGRPKADSAAGTA